MSRTMYGPAWSARSQPVLCVDDPDHVGDRGAAAWWCRACRPSSDWPRRSLLPAPGDHLHRGGAAPVGALLLGDPVGCCRIRRAAGSPGALGRALRGRRAYASWPRARGGGRRWRVRLGVAGQEAGRQGDALDLVAQQPDLGHRAGGLGQLGALGLGRGRSGQGGGSAAAWPGRRGRRSARWRSCAARRSRAAAVAMRAWTSASGCGGPARVRGSSAGRRSSAQRTRRRPAASGRLARWTRPSAAALAPTTRSISRWRSGVTAPCPRPSAGTRARASVAARGRRAPSSPPPWGTKGAGGQQQREGDRCAIGAVGGGMRKILETRGASGSPTVPNNHPKGTSSAPSVTSHADGRRRVENAARAARAVREMAEGWEKREWSG